jgi:orotidine-5'-phosphate decarboxylase
MRERLWVALDVDTVKEADRLLERLAGAGVGAKIGSQLYTAAGPAAVEMALKRGVPVFLDLKYHDIPNTVAGAIREATRLGVAMVNVHAAGGRSMLEAAAQAAAAAAKEFKVARPIVLGVTVLTSLDRRALDETGVTGSVEGQVLRLADTARRAGLDGCVASPQEIRILRVALGPGWVIVTPGIRPGGAGGGDDQKRVATPASAIAAGADHLVVGRPITGAADPAAAARALLDEIAASAR